MIEKMVSFGFIGAVVLLGWVLSIDLYHSLSTPTIVITQAQKNKCASAYNATPTLDESLSSQTFFMNDTQSEAFNDIYNQFRLYENNLETTNHQVNKLEALIACLVD